MKIAVLEDNADRIAVMSMWLDERFSMYESTFTDNPDRVIELIDQSKEEILLLSLDHDLFERTSGDPDATGMTVVDYLANQTPTFPVLIHSSNSTAAGTMVRRLKRSGWTVKRVYPCDDTAWIGDAWVPAIRTCLRQFAVRESVVMAPT